MYVLVVQNTEKAREDAPPFIPDSMVTEGLWGIQVYGPYPSQDDASDALRSFPNEGFNLSVRPLNHLSEDTDNPYGHYMVGDSRELP